MHDSQILDYTSMLLQVINSITAVMAIVTPIAINIALLYQNGARYAISPNNEHSDTAISITLFRN
jgi:hypothetical protein